jgi:hypothetical protein
MEPQLSQPQSEQLGLSGSAYVEGMEQGVQGMLCADARGLCVQGTYVLRCIGWNRSVGFVIDRNRSVDR